MTFRATFGALAFFVAPGVFAALRGAGLFGAMTGFLGGALRATGVFAGARLVATPAFFCRAAFLGAAFFGAAFFGAAFFAEAFLPAAFFGAAFFGAAFLPAAFVAARRFGRTAVLRGRGRCFFAMRASSSQWAADERRPRVERTRIGRCLGLSPGNL